MLSSLLLFFPLLANGGLLVACEKFRFHGKKLPAHSSANTLASASAP